ncbi:MAG: GGDEF domain-containing protein [Chromatiaceae bacterium]|nr:GGDEF domain-containing protein [Gammaproteobacteria bacterium]MCP5304890.1 GGDEF domain-containing protein [Chromatiaceae bacterium]MCP5314849.1 GGDEF domain-containing protein [Chromatiaceae bacterium]
MPEPEQHISYDKTIDIVRSALPRMSELKIPITPSNYAVWYEYLNASNQPLRAEMDALLSRDQPITDAEMRALYQRYLEERSDNVRLAKAALGQMLHALMMHINQADGHFSSLSEELNDVAHGLEGDLSAGDLNQLIDRAVRATNVALEHGAELKHKFSALAAEMQEMRSELARSQEEARKDPLTGLHNRLAFQEQLADLVESAAQDDHAPCLLLIDIDLFKQVNDSHGHLAGDHVLQRVAAEISGCVRGRDLVARHGGEEFAVLLRDTPRSGCQAVGENIRQHIERSQVALPGAQAASAVVSVTLSIGGAWYREAESIAAFVDRADRALYLSKRAGRNRVSWEGRRNDN